MITQVKFVSIPTRDQNRALKFYTEKLGFEVATDQVFDAKQRWIELRIANSPTRVVLFTPDGHENRIGGFFNGSFASMTSARLIDNSLPAASSSQVLRRSSPGASLRSSKTRTAISSSCHLPDRPGRP